MPPEPRRQSPKIQWNEVTWYSKLFAILFFLGVVPSLSFYIGTQYELTRVSLQNLSLSYIPNSNQTASPAWEKFVSKYGYEISYPSSVELEGDVLNTGGGYPVAETHITVPTSGQHELGYDITISVIASTTIADAESKNPPLAIECGPAEQDPRISNLATTTMIGVPFASYIFYNDDNFETTYNLDTEYQGSCYSIMVQSDAQGTISSAASNILKTFSFTY